MHHLIYISQAVRPLSQTELSELLVYCRLANTEKGITGALVYGDGQFMQVLEGERATLKALYARIAQDPRHTNVFKLTDEAIGQRRFGQWAMGFRAVSAAELARLAGYQSPAQMRAALPVLTCPEATLITMMDDLLSAAESPAPMPG